MSKQTPIKLIPRNVAALRRGQPSPKSAQLVAGNPVSTRLESGVGNCFPGLECDLRGLERRFFPFLEVDILNVDFEKQEIDVVSVDLVGVQAASKSGDISAATAATYREINTGISKKRRCSIIQMQGTFGPLGMQALVISKLKLPSSGPNRLPSDAWTAIRLLTEGTEVTLTLSQGNKTLSLVGDRARYLDDNGALAKMFLPGELTQSLCSPWTHDFRDCACFYWASNHPDIVLPVVPNALPATPEIYTYVPWERQDRTLTTLPRPATFHDPVQLSHYEINDKWQTLNFVLENREIVAPYTPGSFTALKLADKAELIVHLRYAAGVELAVIHEYLAAAYSLKVTGIPTAARDDVSAARAEILRIAYGEMRHVRAVNDVVRALDPAGYKPALRVASQVPAPKEGEFLKVAPSAATPAAIQAFIDIERPSDGVDGLYARILVTLEDLGTDEMIQTIRSVIADGETHFETFSFIQEWLNRHPDPSTYLTNPNAKVAPPDNKLHQTLQKEYADLLRGLYRGYTLGIPAGAPNINGARNAMLGKNGLDGAAENLAAAGFLVAFDRIADRRFAPLDPP